MRFLLLLLLSFNLFAQDKITLTDEIRVEIMQWASPMRVRDNKNHRAELMKKNIVRMLDILMLLEQQKKDKELILLLLKRLQEKGIGIND